MTNAQLLYQALATDARTAQISKHFRQSSPLPIKLTGLAGSSVAFLAAEVIRKDAANHLFVIPNRDNAAYFLNDLENLLGKENVKFFPATGKAPYQHHTADNSNLVLRAEVLNQIMAKEPFVVVTYPEAIVEKVVTQSHLAKNTLKVKKNEKLSIDFIVDLLIEYGFNRADFVIEPGEFSLRGGIIDVFSYSSDNPYRIELMGDTVESVRSFDATTQLTIEMHDSIAIVPNIQHRLLQESRQSFFQYIPKDVKVWLSDPGLLETVIEKEFRLATHNFEKADQLIAQLPPDELYLSPEQFFVEANSFSRVEYGLHFLSEPQETIRFNIQPQTTFNKKFDLLIADLKKHTEQGFVNYIFFDTEKQAERLRAIFDDLAGKNTLTWESIGHTLHEGFVDQDQKIACYTDHQIFERFHRYKVKNTFNKTKEAITLKELRGLNPGDYITHIDHGVGRYGGLEKLEVNGRLQESIRLVYKDNDILYVSIQNLHRISKYGSKEGAIPKLDKLGSQAWQNLKQTTKKKVKEIAYDLIKLYAERKAKKGFAYSPDTYLQNELEASFIYEDTPDQLKATKDVKKDMEESAPMDRLVCGDVGFGKTEIAIRAAFKAATDGKQVAVMAPTTLLTRQHFKTFTQRLKGMPCNVDYINRFKTAKEQKETLRRLEEGKIDILIGTHRIVGKDVKFSDLGLLIIDEEHKFGVGVKDKLKTIKANVDTLTLTATPIPRTLQFSMMGARDLSIINTPPPNRQPVQTEVLSFDHDAIRDAIQYEIERGGQVFFIHNRVNNLLDIELMIRRLCPTVRVLAAHGQMDAAKLEEAMVNFIDGDYDVLVSTTIVESGIDIPNANTMIINDAHSFGLSDLHQLRGRVGRSNRKAYCYLITPPPSALTSEAQKRLRAISEFSELGSGFQIAMRDLDIRGAGNLLGAEQSGFITDMGYEMYQKILNEAMMELRLEEGIADGGDGNNHQPGDFVIDCHIDTDLELLIPDSYISNITERLTLYRELDDAKEEADLLRFMDKLRDRFGEIPVATIDLINAVRLRWLSLKIGFEKLTIKNGRLVGTFISKHNAAYYESKVFSAILGYVQKNPNGCKMKEQNQKLTLAFENVNSVPRALEVLQKVVDVISPSI